MSISGYTYQWKRDGGNIGGATSSTYALVTADDGHNISCAVTATNTGGSTAQASNAVGPVVAILACTTSDTSLSSDSIQTRRALYAAALGELYPGTGLYPGGGLYSGDPASTSLSTDTAIAGRDLVAAAGDTSASSDTALAARGSIDYSGSRDSATATQAAGRTVFDVSLSVDSAIGGHFTFMWDVAVSTDTATGSIAGSRTVLEVSLSSDAAQVLSHIATATASDTSTARDTTSVSRWTGISDTSLSSDHVVVYVQFTGYQIHVRERAPLRLTVNVTTPNGARARWGADDPRGENVPGGLNFSTVMPGGFEQGSNVLARDPSYSYPDLVELSKIQVVGAGNQIAHEGRLESYPSTGGDQAQITPTWLGYQDHLTDDSSAREIFVDRAISTWQGPSVQRQLEWLQMGPVYANASSIGPDFTTQFPSLIEELDGSWTDDQVVEAWYDGCGIPLGELYAAWKTNGQYTLTGGNSFGAEMFLVTDDTGVSYDQSGSILSTPGVASLTPTQNRPWALLQFWNDTVPGGKDGASFILYWSAVAVYGRHGLPTYWPPGSNPYSDAQGVLASDVMAYALQRWAPLIKYSTGINGTIQPSSFIIPHLVFTTPGTVADMQTAATSFELLDWAVWEGPQYYLNAKGARGNKWRTRIGAAALQEAGPQIGRLWNGVNVSFTDVTGKTRTVGPPGSGANQEYTALLDPDPDNPSNQVFDANGRVLRRWAPLSAGISDWSQAVAVGTEFLAEQKLLDTSGQATITGHVQSGNGIWQPAYMMRAGDKLSVADSSDTSYRRLVHTAYDDSTKANTLQLDQPPDGMQQLLERLQVSLVPFGM